MNKTNDTGSRNVVRTTRDAVVGAADSVRTLQKKTAELAAKVGKRWEASKPRQERAKDELKKVGRKVVTFGKDVRKGLEEGLAEAKKRGKM